MIAVTPLITPIAVKIGSRQAIGIGFVAAAVGFGALVLADASWAYLAFVLPLVAIAAGLALSNGPASSASTSAVPENQVGAASGISNMARYIGGSLAVAATSTVYATVTARRLDDGASQADALAAGLSRSALLMALMCAAGVGLAFLAGRHRPPETTGFQRVAAAAAATHTIPTPAYDGTREGSRTGRVTV
jgi:sugar phosphate permease